MRSLEDVHVEDEEANSLSAKVADADTDGHLVTRANFKRDFRFRRPLNIARNGPMKMTTEHRRLDCHQVEFADLDFIINKEPICRGDP